MNLTNHILHHIYFNLGIESNVNVSILSDSFILPKKISFEIDNEIKSVNLWGAQIAIDKSIFKILCADLSVNEKEYALIVKLDNCPIYGSYLSFNPNPVDGMLLFSLKDNEWLISNTYIQATFLAGMEQLKDFGATWTTLSSFDDLIENVKSLIEYQNNFLESE